MCASSTVGSLRSAKHSRERGVTRGCKTFIFHDVAWQPPPPTPSSPHAYTRTNSFTLPLRYSIFRGFEPGLRHLWHPKTCGQTEARDACTSSVLDDLGAQETLARALVDHGIGVLYAYLCVCVCQCAVCLLEALWSSIAWMYVQCCVGDCVCCVYT